MNLLDQFVTSILKNRGPLSQEFIELGCRDWNRALLYINQLPYIRNSNGNSFHLVLEEHRGTCSTKHALLAALAEEQQFPLSLMMGLIEMSAKKFFPLAPVLKKYDLPAVLETHCYLSYEGQRIDITFPGHIFYPKSLDFLKEWTITPRDIGDKKNELHQKEMKLWMAEKKIPYSFEKMWQIREECIDELSKKKF